MNLPIVCFDMDGTLLDAQGRVHPDDVALLASASPRLLFVPTTGRPISSVRSAFARSGLYLDCPIPLNMILQNGSVLMAPQERLLSYMPLDAGIQQDLLALALRTPQVTFLFLTATDIHALWPHPFAMQLAASFDFEVRQLTEQDFNIPFSKVMCMSDSASALADLAASIASWPVEAAFSMPPLLEITNHNVDKGNALRLLLQKLGLSDQPVYAAGDGDNDLPLFQVAAVSFAPSTAPDSIRSAASHVIDVQPCGLLAPILSLIG